VKAEGVSADGAGLFHSTRDFRTAVDGTEGEREIAQITDQRNIADRTIERHGPQ
jgi:hypothetical protein